MMLLKSTIFNFARYYVCYPCAMLTTVLYPQVLLAMITSWIICVILTAAGVFPETEGKWGYKARTDINTEVLHKSEWFRFPYPGEVKVYGEVYNLSLLNVHAVRTATGQKDRYKENTASFCCSHFAT